MLKRVLGALALGVVPVLALAAQPPPAAAGHQWAIGLVVGWSSFSGATEGTGPNGEEITFVPYRPGIAGIRVSHGRSGPRLEASVQFGRPGLELRGVQGTGGEAAQSGLLIVGESVYHLWSFGVGASTRLVRLDGAASLRPLLGLVLERWSASDSPGRIIAGGEAGLGLEVPLKGPFVAELGGAVGFTPRSPFRREDVPGEFRLTGTWRRSVKGTVYWRF